MPWEVMPDLFFYRDPEEADKEERERQEAAAEAKPEMAVPTKVTVQLKKQQRLLYLLVESKMLKS